MSSLIWHPLRYPTAVYVPMAWAAADRHGLEGSLVCAICEEESGARDVTGPLVETWQPTAVRFEAAFLRRYIHPAVPVAPTTKELTRAMSFGLMQVMGQTAIEQGFVGRFLTDLCDPDTGLEFGCRYLAHLATISMGSDRIMLLHYNGGADHAYPDRVLARRPKYTREAMASMYKGTGAPARDSETAP